MLDKLIQLVEEIIGPETGWDRFLRKSISIMLVAALGAYSWDRYTEYIAPVVEVETSVEASLTANPSKRKLVQRELDVLLKILPNASSVWLYSWPDARHLRPVMSAGEGPDPMPLGYLRHGDEDTIGHFVLGKCTQLPRNFVNVSCPVIGIQDAWGVLIVVYNEEPPSRPEAVEITAEKISHIVYLAKQ